MKIFRIIALLLSIAALNYAQTPEPIVNIRTNDSDGIPTRLGEVVTISGIVTADNNFGNNGPANIEDPTAGISIYGSGFANQVNIGDSVTITSTVDQFRGMTQLNFNESGSSFVNHGQALEPIEPNIVTLSEITNQAWNGTELIEGELVRVNNITINGSGSFAGGTNYTISDGSVSLDMRIDNDVASIIGTSIPSGNVDLIGVVGQFKFNAPYSSGYQILPRFIEDIVTENTPLILTPVVASNVTSNSFTVYYNTLRNGDSEVRYGITTAIELDTVKIAEDTTVHIVPITGLEELTKYYYKVYSTNEVGTSESDIYTVTTASSNPSIGDINVYFNYSVDNSVAIPGNEAQGNIDFRDKLIGRINASTYSIDLAVYSFFGLNDVANAIVAAKNRGVKVRVVYDDRAIQSSMQILLDNGILMSQRPNIEGIMHNKFAIFDSRDSEPTNDWVWTGSWNWTSTELNWRNNVVEINDPSLAQTYQDEFEEMWGSENDTPNSANAKFGSNKTDNTSHSFSIGGKDVKLYFSPSDQTESQIISSIASADSSIYFAILSFTSDGIFSSIDQRHSLGITDIRGIINDVNVQGSEFTNLQNLSGSEVFAFNIGGTLHHKYGLVDPSAASSNPITITGSHNWSRSANERNDENTLIINDVYIANQYMQEFKKRYNELGGTTVFNIPVLTSVNGDEILPSTLVLDQNYPNPFNPVTTISFTLPASEYVDLSVYNLLGEKVAVVYSGLANSGKTVVDFNAAELSSGIYFYTLSTQSDSFTKKLMLLK